MNLSRILALAALAGAVLWSASGAQAQTWAVGDTLTVIQKPLQNIPDIVLPGQDLEVYCEADPATQGWSASLERGELTVPLALESAVHDSAIAWWRLTFVVPEVPVFDLYDLRVEAEGGVEDLARQSVKVQAVFPEEFYWVHITDTHLPTYLYYDQNGAATDSSTTIGLRHITRDVNLINPAFVLLTGDLIHEGELEDFLERRYYSRAQRQLREFQVPVFLTAGNHDIGGWEETPPVDGTARRNWWKFFGWKRLENPPSGAPLRTQNYSFDYGPVHFTGLEAYDNYDYWRFEYYGYESFTFSQMNWLGQDLAASDRQVKVLFHHHDFDNELNLSALGVDMSLSGHIHRDTEDSSAPYLITTDNASGTNRPFRLVRFANGQLSTGPSLEAGFDGETLTASYLPANDGTHDQVTVVINNGYNQSFEYGQVKVVMPGGMAGYQVTGGQMSQVDNTGPLAICYIDVNIAPLTTTQVTVAVDTASPVLDQLPGAARLLGAYPNPFNPRTEIAFELSQAASCRLTVFDIMGREVAVLADGLLEQGQHRYLWQGTDAQGQAMPSGTYLVALRAGSYAESQKITLVR